MKFRRNESVAVAAAKVSISTASGYRIESEGKLPSQKQIPRGRRRPDPLAGIFDEEVVPMLNASQGRLRPVGIFHELMRQHPELDPGIRRTLERRVRAWCAHYGPEPWDRYCCTNPWAYRLRIGGSQSIPGLEAQYHTELRKLHHTVILANGSTVIHL